MIYISIKISNVVKLIINNLKNNTISQISY